MAKYFADRAKGGVALIVTGGVAPNLEGRVQLFGGDLKSRGQAQKYKEVTDAVHAEGGRICMQILHTGRYAYSPIQVAPSAIPSPISKSPIKPMAMPKFMIRKTIRDFVRCATLAKEAGFDGVEIMGSEGYLLNEFLVTHTNKRTDQYGGSFENRMRFPLEVLEAVRKAVPKDFIILFRVSMLDLVPNGQTKEEVFQFAERVAQHADIITTGIGWHEARIPTIATSVPRAAYTWVTRGVRDHLLSKGITTPLVTTNRINDPTVAEKALQDGHADMVSMARPFLADPDFVQKAKDGKADQINMCIGCNQACLDHVFKGKISSCLVNPMACHETTRALKPATAPKKVAVIGAGPGGLWCAFKLAERGHQVTLFEKSGEIGGQFNIAKRIPGKEEFYSSIKYWTKMLDTHRDNLTLKLNTTATVETLDGFDEVVVATGCMPRPKRNSDIDGVEGAQNVATYLDVITGKTKIDPNANVVIIGAGGIGHDTAVFLTHKHNQTIQEYCKTWGIDETLTTPGFTKKPDPTASGDGSHRKIVMLQRTEGKMGAKLGATTGWIHRNALKLHKVGQMTGVKYDKVSDTELIVTQAKSGKSSTLPFTTLVLCHGQVSVNNLVKPLQEKFGEGKVHVIGGAKNPSELDAKRAILEGHLVAQKM
eukprot:GILI01010198.1.p1 GENE.GILI01010198.1~~GILI01010198.1.p1  ORF type:complete len:664 (+),score=153.99 GILI01010198.1:41-1993(+)